MGIFSNKKIIIGLFGSDREAEQAMEMLSQHGIGDKNSSDKIELMDQYSFSGLATDRDTAVAMPAPTGSNNPIGLVPVMEDADPNPRSAELAIKQDLMDRGIEESQASFFARRVARDGVLLVVETDENHADQVAAVLRQTGAQETVI